VSIYLIFSKYLAVSYQLLAISFFEAFFLRVLAFWS
jgi:hypothetical protein